MDTDYIPKATAARLCGVSARTIRRWVEKVPHGLIRYRYEGPPGDQLLYVHKGDITCYARSKRPGARLPK